MTPVHPLTVTCTRCKVPTDPKAMGRQRSRRNGLHSWCRKCINAWNRDRRKLRNDTPEQRRRWDLKRRYDLTPEQLDEMISKQQGRCAICQQPMKRRCIDHDHATGSVRGLLCHGCNVKLHALDKWPHRDAAIRYLQRCAT